MGFVGGGVQSVLQVFMIAWGLGLFGSFALRMAGWSWCARVAVLIPVYAVLVRTLYRLLHNSAIVIF